MYTIIAYFCKLTAYAKLGEALHQYVKGLWQHTELKKKDARPYLVKRKILCIYFK